MKPKYKEIIIIKCFVTFLVYIQHNVLQSCRLSKAVFKIHVHDAISLTLLEKVLLKTIPSSQTGKKLPLLCFE